MFEIIQRILKTGRITGKYPMNPPARFHGELRLDQDKCVLCQKCSALCPTGALKILTNADTPLFVDPHRCFYCGICSEACPSKALVRTPLPAQPVRQKKGDDNQDNSTKTNNLSLEEKISVKIRKIFGKSLHIRHVNAGSCNACDFEMAALLNPYYDLQRLGIDFVASPRHADILMVTGGITRHLAEAVGMTYDAAPTPKMVIAVGSCACSGGPEACGYAENTGVDRMLPVSVYIPGCPPRPQALLEGILLALTQYDKQ